MFDYYGMPFKENAVQVFIGQSSSNDWFTWRKPRSASMLFFLVIGGGAGGGGGFSGSGVSRGGGGGGAASGIANLIIPACVLPDTLYIQALLGGAGGSAASNGSNGTNAYVSISQSTDVDNLVLKAMQGVASPGTGATSGTAAAGGSAATIISTQGRWASLGIWQAINPPSNDGRAGGNSVSAGTNTFTTSCMTMGGAGGGGVSSSNVASNGGNVVGLDPISTIPGGTGFSDAGGGNGSAYNINIPTAFKMGQVLPFFGTAGSGGGGGGAGTGGSGGDAGIGSGGGGGGAGTTGGRGGNGGPGMVAIWAW